MKNKSRKNNIDNGQEVLFIYKKRNKYEKAVKRKDEKNTKR